jgi:GH24 family phage-related lysozyme (muramidase)
MSKIIKLTESQLTYIIKNIINENDSSFANGPETFTIEDQTLNGFYKKVKEQTRGKKIVLESIRISLSDNGNSTIKFQTAENQKPVILLVPFSEELDKGKCPSCENVKAKNPKAKLIKTGKFGKNRVFHVYAVPNRNVKTPATRYSMNTINVLSSDKAESFRSQIYDDKCPNAEAGKYCGGNLTIGYGTLVRNYPELEKYKKGSKYHLSKSQGTTYLKKHLDKNVVPYLVKKIETPLYQKEFDALCVFLYNIGKLNDNMVNAINNLDENNLKKIWLNHSYWNNKFSEGLAERRIKEWNMFLNGKYQ